MKKIILALVTSSVMLVASETTVTATMKLMQQGMDQINTGFMLNSKYDIEQGITTLENSSAIFTTVNVGDFIKTNKVTVANNVNKNLTRDIKALKKAMSQEKYSDATKQYAKVLNNCMTCHTITRGW